MASAPRESLAEPALCGNVGRLASVIASRRPDDPATVLDGRTWSYREFARRVDRLAGAMMAAGVGKGDRVAALQTPHPDFLVSLFATASVGAIWVGLNPKHREDELQHAVRDSQPTLILARSRVGARAYTRELALLRSAAAPGARVVLFAGEPAVAGAEPYADFLQRGAAISSDAVALRAEQAGGLDPCLIVYTSGSTGVPKGALLHHRGILEFAAAQNRIWPIWPHRVINYFPISHIGSVIDLSIPCLAAGGLIVFMENFDPADCLALMEQHRVTLWAGVPSVFRMQIETPGFEHRDLSAVQLIVWEGAGLPEDLLHRLLSLGPPLATNYGMTEAGSAITVVEPCRDPDILLGVGRPFPGVSVRLVREDGQDAATGEAGEVWATSPHNMIGYWRRPEATKETLMQGWLRTGDLAERRADGRYRIVGRLKEMFKSGGYNVYPREIEMALESHPAVTLAAVIGVPDPVWQEVGVAYVTLERAAQPDELLAWCRERVANYKTPKRLEVLPAMPLLPIGKIDKSALRRRACGGEDGANR